MEGNDLPSHPTPSDDYERGQRDGLRLALSVLDAEEAKWHATLGESHSGRTNFARSVRHKTLQVAARRIETRLNRLKPREFGNAVDVELASALTKIGL